MPTNYEIVFDEFIPAFRARVAKIMKERGMSQEKTASILEITQAAISKYISGRYSDKVKNIENELSDAMANEFVDDMLQSENANAQKVICRACQGYHKFDCSIMSK